MSINVDNGKARPVAQSLFPDLRPERPVGPILPSVFRGTNAALMAAVAPYYLTGTVMDATYGKGGWWSRFRPASFVGHDIDTAKGDGVDFTALPEDDETYDAITFDPPYIPQGGYETSTAPEFVGRFGLTSRSRSDLWDLIAGGMAECTRVLRVGGYLLVKCTDFVNGGAFHLGHRKVLDFADPLGLVCHDLIVHHTGSGPGGWNIYDPLRARRHHSYLLVFKRSAGAVSVTEDPPPAFAVNQDVERRGVTSNACAISGTLGEDESEPAPAQTGPARDQEGKS